MVWNKTPKEKVEKIIETLSDIDKTYIDIAKEFQVSEWLVGQIATKNLSKELLKARYSRLCRNSKLGKKNPMYGKKGALHHNANLGISRTMGYKSVFKPEWFTGKGVKDNRVYEHHYVWCQFYNQTEIPKGCVIHHIDLDIDNNSIENLQLLTISEHMKLHQEIRKVQRLERNLVGNSVPEAHGNQ